LAYPSIKKKKLGVVANFWKPIRKNHIRQNAGKENKNRPVSGFFTKITYVQVINFIPVKVSTLYYSLYVGGYEFSTIKLKFLCQNFPPSVLRLTF
jgi:hypothetical protein